MKICAVTGHQGSRFRFKYKDSNNGCKRLKRRMQGQFTVLYEEGVRQFWIGGGLGVDIWAGEILLRMKEQPEYSELELKIALPFTGYDAKWDDRSKLRMAFLVRHSCETIVVGTDNCPPSACYRKRDRYLIEQADCLIAVYDNDRTISNGVGSTVRQAEQKNMTIIFIHPDTGAATREP